MKKGWKTWICLALTLTVVLALAGCGDAPAETTAPKSQETTAPAAPETTAPIADNCYVFEYAVETGAESDANGRSEARKNTYVNGTSKNGDYNVLSIGAVGVMGLDGKTALTLNEDGTYLLVKTLVSTKVGVDIKYQFEGSYTREGSTVTLAAPTAASAIEIIAAGMKSNGINPNYGELTSSADDARILNWFPTVYISYVEGDIAPMVVTVNDADMTMTVEMETAEPDETVPAETTPAETVLTKSIELPASDGNITTVTLTFLADGTFSSDKGFGGTWSMEEGVPVSTEGTWDAEANVWTFSFYSGKVTLPVEMTEDDLAALNGEAAGEPEAVAEITATVGDKELLLTFYSDHSYKVTMGEMSVNSGKWKIENRTIVMTQVSGGEEKEPVTMNAERTLLMMIGSTEVPFVLDNTALMALNSVG